MLAIDADTGQPVPSVSILIAARNEAGTILDCLRSIEQLQTPTHFLEVLIGNDQSTDQTAERVAAFMADKPRYILVDITETLPGLQGKANVLAQLAQRARGEFLVFTDADTCVPPEWINGLLQAFQQQVGIVTGVTLPKGPRLFHTLQALDWLYNLTLVYGFSQLGIPLTAMGNNMAVRKAAYNAVGGYASLPFSVVEDYTLFRAIVAKGYAFQQLLDTRVLATTQPVDSISAFLQQRKRWMRGAMQLPALMVLFLHLNYLIGPILLLLGWFAPLLAVSLYCLRLVLQTTLLTFGISRLKQPYGSGFVLLFELYQLFMGPIALAYYWCSGNVVWKGRTFSK